MADRGFSAAALAQIGAASSMPGHLYQCYLDDGTVYATDFAVPVSWGGNTYQALSHFLGFDRITERADATVESLRLTLAGVDQTWVSTVLSANYVDRRVVIYKAFLAPATWTLVVDPSAIFEGRISDASITEDPDSGKCEVGLDVSSHWIDWDRRSGRHTNHAEQQVHFPGDLFFEYASEINQQILWGRSG